MAYGCHSISACGLSEENTISERVMGKRYGFCKYQENLSYSCTLIY